MVFTLLLRCPSPQRRRKPGRDRCRGGRAVQRIATRIADGPQKRIGDEAAVWVLRRRDAELAEIVKGTDHRWVIVGLQHGGLRCPVNDRR